MLSTLINYLTSLDRSVAKNLKHAKAKTRPGASNGLWLCLLLPLILSIGCLRCAVSPVYQLTGAVSLGLLLSSVLLVSFVAVSGGVLSERVHGASLASGAVAALVCVWVLSRGVLFSLAVCVSSTCLYTSGVSYVLTALPCCFTAGEAMLVLQGLVLFGASAVWRVAQAVRFAPETDEEIISLIVQTGLLTVCAIIYLMSCLRGARHVGALLVSVGGLALALLLFLHVVLGQSSVVWIMLYVGHRKRLLLIAWWATLTALSALAVRADTQSGRKATSAGRKVFHAAAGGALLAGCLVEPALTALAAGVAMAMLLLLEALRKSNIEPVSSILQDSFDTYADEKDCGGLSLTPMYLLAGVSCPLALTPRGPGCELRLLSGVLSAGVGDAAASWAGSRYGRHRWSGSEKTMEGTLANILSQFLTVYLLHYCGFLQGEHVLERAALASFVSGICEAATDQIDNLVLPLITLITLMLY